MTRSFLERLTKCKENITAIKTIQRTQADSYKFYKYRTEDLYNDSTRVVEVIFHPLKENEQVICDWQFADLRGESSFYWAVSVDNPLQCTFAVIPNVPAEAWKKHCYITCISNCEGFLQTIIH